MGRFTDFLIGSKAKLKQSPTMAPYQQQQFQGAVQNPIEQSPLYGAGSNFLQQLLSSDPATMERFAAPHLRQFNEQIAPGIAERFAGAGTGAGALGSSAFANSLAQAGAGLSERLAALQGQMQLQGAGTGLAYAQQPYQNAYQQAQIPTFQNFYQPGSQGLFQGLGSSAGQGVGIGLGLGPLSNYFSNWGGNNNQQQQPNNYGNSFGSGAFGFGGFR